MNDIKDDKDGQLSGEDAAAVSQAMDALMTRKTVVVSGPNGLDVLSQARRNLEAQGVVFGGTIPTRMP